MKSSTNYHHDLERKTVVKCSFNEQNHFVPKFMFELILNLFMNKKTALESLDSNKFVSRTDCDSF